MSMSISVKVGFGLPHQLGTCLNTIDCLGVYALIVYAPVPICSPGLDHQFTGSAWITFSSRIVPVLAWRLHAAMHQPHGLASPILTVYGSGAVRPFIMNVGSPLARCASVCVRQAVTSAPLAQKVFPAGWTARKPLMPDRLLLYGPRRATERFQEYRTSFEVTGSPLENFTFCFSFTVTVIPSAEISPLVVGGTSTAISGVGF